MPSLTDVGADLRAGSSSVAAAGVALSSAGASVRVLLSTAEAMQLDALATRLAELLARVSELTRATADLQQSLRAALATTTSPPGPAPAPSLRAPAARLRSKEIAVVDYLVGRGATVEILPEDHSQYRIKHPDAVVTRPGEEPVVTEFKTLEKPTTSAVKGLIKSAASQLAQHGGGDVVIDARAVDLDEATARRGYARARGEARVHGRPMPRRTYIILDDGRHIILSEDGA